jgi:hypothetical protein
MKSLTLMKRGALLAWIAVLGLFPAGRIEISKAQAQAPRAAAPNAPAEDPSSVAPIVPPRAGTSETVRFAGNSLDGWEGSSEYWSAKQGAYIAKASGKVTSTFLLTKKAYSDFRITLSSRVVESTNHAGVCLWGGRNASATNPWAYKGLLVVDRG